jgi:hypothetical protein
MSQDNMFKPYLKEGEEVIWQGKPKSGLQLRDADIILIPVSIILIGFAVVLDYTMMLFEAPFIFKLAGVMFALAGIYFGGIRFFLDRNKRVNTYYCVTRKRVLVISGRKRKLQTLPLKNIERLDLTEEKDGSGFIIFGNTNPLWPWLLGKFIMAGDQVPGLELIPEVKKVYSMLEQEIKIEIDPALLQQVNEPERRGLN